MILQNTYCTVSAGVCWRDRTQKNAQASKYWCSFIYTPKTRASQNTQADFSRVQYWRGQVQENSTKFKIENIVKLGKTEQVCDFRAYRRQRLRGASGISPQRDSLFFYFVKNNLYLRIPTYVYFAAPERQLPNRCSCTVSISSYDGFTSSMFRRIDDVWTCLEFLHT